MKKWQKTYLVNLAEGLDKAECISTANADGIEEAKIIQISDELAKQISGTLLDIALTELDNPS